MASPSEGGFWWTASVFLASRALVLAIILVATRATVVRHTFGARVIETRIELRQLGPAINQAFVVGDAEWFRSIAMDGYAAGPFDKSRQRNWAFLPAWPLLLRLVDVVPFAIAGVLLANLCFLGGLLCFRRVAALAGSDAATADAATLALAFFPSSYFFSVPVSESLFFALSAGAVLLMYRRQWWAASALICAASAARVTGILLIGVAFLLHHAIERRWVSTRLISLVIAPLGLAGFMLYLRWLTGNAFAFADLQALWRRHPSQLFEPIVEAIRVWPVVSAEWNFIALQLVITVGLIAACVHLAFHRQFGLAFFVATSVALALSSGSLQSMNRYALSAWPAFYPLGRLIGRGLQRELWIAFSAALLGAFCLLFALRVDIALA